MDDRQYNRTQCLESLTGLVQTTPTFPLQYPTYFFSTSLEFPQLTLQGCRELCGRRWGPYVDNKERILSWIIPLLFLLVNISYPAIGAKRFWTVFRVIGDPISCIWSQLMTLRLWDISIQNADGLIAKALGSNTGETVHDAVAMVFSATARYSRSLELKDKLDQALERTCSENLSTLEREAHFRKLLNTGLLLANARTIDIRRAVFAVMVYVTGVATLLWPGMGGTTPFPSGGRVPPAMLLIWLLPCVLLSNAVGDTTSWRHAETILQSFATDTMYLISDDGFTMTDDNSEVTEHAITITESFTSQVP